MFVRQSASVAVLEHVCLGACGCICQCVLSMRGSDCVGGQG
jgi:hypothetical protein